jgi:phage shock protein C
MPPPPTPYPRLTPPPGVRRWFAEKGLTRLRESRVLGGVCAGLARRYDVNSLVTRVLAVLFALIVSPLPYIALWVLMPHDS